MKTSKIKYLVQRMGGSFLITVLAGYTIWYCEAALAPFSEIRKVTSLDQKLRLSLFQAESFERGYLLTGKGGSVSAYLQQKQELLGQLDIFTKEICKEKEPDLAQVLTLHVRQRIDEMDSAVYARQRHDLIETARIVRANIALQRTAQICKDLDRILAIEKRRNINW